MKTSLARRVAFSLLAILLLTLFVGGVHGLRPKKTGVVIDGYMPWSKEVRDAARAIPVQEGGRVKPLETQAHYAMLKMRGDRKIVISNGKEKEIKVEPIDLMLDMLFRPEYAKQLPVFRVDNNEILYAVGLIIEGRKKRDRYSFAELEPNLSELLRRAGDFRERKSRGATLTPVEEQTIALVGNISDFFYYCRHFEFARSKIELTVEKGEGKKVPMSVVLASMEYMVEAIRKNQQASGELPEHVKELLAQIERGTKESKFGFHAIPPYERSEKKWFAAGELAEAVIRGEKLDRSKVVEDMKRLEELSEASTTVKFASVLRKFAKTSQSHASESEIKPISRELAYLKAGYFEISLYCFGIAMLASLFILIAPGSFVAKVLRMFVWGSAGLGLFIVLVAIAHRFFVVYRAPVTTLYETIPFITAGIVMVCLVVEAITRRGLALGLAPVMGLGGMVLALVFEVSNANDSLDPLVAVLRSNFWLSTHVLTVTLGYAAGLLAAAFSTVYILCRLLGLDHESPDLRRQLTRITCGIVCFTLLLSMVGTILGGIWANYSWGRFWGWDPKENGALMIVLWTLVILHGRLAGLLKEWGIHLATAFLAIVVTFSWFHVNMLGTGLHAYGFMAGKQIIWYFYGAMALLIVLGAGASLAMNPAQRQRSRDTGRGLKVPSAT